jgi:hypothetical protein
MSVLRLRSLVVATGVVALVAPQAIQAQTREVVAKEVSVGRAEATLRLEFADQQRLEISFANGNVLVDGEVIGSYAPGSDLDAAWRDLLGQAVALDDGPLSEMLSDWTVPADLAGELADVARDIDQALEDALSEVDVQMSSDTGTISVSLGDGNGLIEALVGSLGRLGVLEEALEGLDRDVRVHFDEDLVVPAGTVVEGTVVVIRGTARIEGEVDGDLVVVGGALDLGEGGRVTGEVRVADTRIVRNEGSTTRIVDLIEEDRESEAELRDRIRNEIEREVRGDLRGDMRDSRRGDDGGFSVLAPFRPVGRAIGGVAEKAIAILLLALLGAGVLAFAGDNVDVIAETARRSPGRSAMVGFAGTILLLPVWLLGTVALAVSIIFIPVAIAWLPLFPLAACFAALIGYLAVARNTGEWLADSEYPWTGWIRKSNSWVTMLGGLIGLMFAFVAANVVSIAPFLGFLSGLLVVAGGIITFIAVQIGFGAVLLTRAGRRREAWGPQDPDAAWEAAMNVDVDVEVDSGPTAGPTAGWKSRPSERGAPRRDPKGDQNEEGNNG